ncbi:hypothetical protein ACFPYI_12755 [Halomarina salina]|uniref:Uncharacterized protein n=1 Tax=Halomarina salina TaxID=1872699 RepID=A0ABD5RP42_9EURY|nr:hypothetical protein [Halomarina salina]
MEDTRHYLRQASEQLDTSADVVRDVGTRSTLSFLASELADVARDGGQTDVERFRRTLGTLERRLSGSAVASVRQAQRSLDRYERVST